VFLYKGVPGAGRLPSLLASATCSATTGKTPKYDFGAKYIVILMVLLYQESRVGRISSITLIKSESQSLKGIDFPPYGLDMPPSHTTSYADIGGRA
jgi:hypothetical protein